MSDELRREDDKRDIPTITQPRCVLQGYAAPTKEMLPQARRHLYLRQNNFDSVELLGGAGDNKGIYPTL